MQSAADIAVNIFLKAGSFCPTSFESRTCPPPNPQTEPLQKFAPNPIPFNNLPLNRQFQKLNQINSLPATTREN